MEEINIIIKNNKQLLAKSLSLSITTAYILILRHIVGIEISSIYTFYLCFILSFINTKILLKYYNRICILIKKYNDCNNDTIVALDILAGGNNIAITMLHIVLILFVIQSISIISLNCGNKILLVFMIFLKIHCCSNVIIAKNVSKIFYNKFVLPKIKEIK